MRDAGGEVRWGIVATWSLIALIATILMSYGLGLGCGAYNRYQARQDAVNHVKIAHTEIEKAEEEAKVNRAQIKATEAEAEKRVAESIGLKKSQVEINKTLTPLYVQHEYVQAIEQAAHSNSNTIEFIPVGQNGLPIIGTTNVGGR